MGVSRPPSSQEAADYLLTDAGLTALRQMLDAREDQCRAIARHAVGQGLDCDWQFVNKHLPWFKRWHTGAIATGYLMGRTGVKRKTPDITHWSE